MRTVTSNESRASRAPAPAEWRRSAIVEWRRWGWWALAATVVMVGVVARLSGIGSGLWLDEFGTFWVAERDLATTVDRAWQFQGQSPLYYALARLSIATFGESEIALRAPSLVCGVLFAWVLFVCARSVAGPRAGAVAAAFAWASVPAIRVSADARPYALSLLASAVAVAGFLGAIRSPTARARLAWIVGGGLVAWSHYVHYPLVLGLAASYVLLREARTAYRPRMFVLDLAAQAALIAPCAWQVLGLLRRRDALAWIESRAVLVFLGPLFQLIPVLILALAGAWTTRVASRATIVERVLWIAIAVDLVVVEGASMVGINLLSPRYVLVIVGPAILIGALASVRARAVPSSAALALYGLITVAILWSHQATGDLSGVRRENWRDAVDALRVRVDGRPESLVLFRSGFVEEDVDLGHPAAATLAPLRSPGRPALRARVVTLSYRWERAGRQEYFARDVVPAIAGAGPFFLLCSTSTPDGLDYCARVVAWVDEQWPGIYHATTLVPGAVRLVEFQTSGS